MIFACSPIPLPYSSNLYLILSKTDPSSIVAGTLYGSPSTIFFRVPRSTFPDLVFGNLSTIIAFRNAATDPNDIQIINEYQYHVLLTQQLPFLIQFSLQ